MNRRAMRMLGILMGLLGCGMVLAAGRWIAPGGEPAPRGVGPPQHPVMIRQPAGPPTIDAGLLDEKGRPVQIACAACHTTKPANLTARLGTPLTAFHANLGGKHANLTCVSCHNPAEGYGSLRLADGTALPYAEVMTLCAQCHGPQYRDYQRGAHGGMTGHWDLSRGERTRKNCIDCHNVHAPKFPGMMPVAGPNDRFLDRKGGHHE